MSAFLTITPDSGFAVSATEAALLERDAQIQNASRCVMVRTAQDSESATTILRDLKSFLDTIESARETVKAAPWKLCKDIDALAKKIVAGVDIEARRISQLLGSWQAEQNRLAEEAKRKAWEEEQRIIREAEAKAKEEAAKAQAELAELNAKADRARSEAKVAEWQQKAAEAKKAAAAASAAHVAATEQQIVENRVAASAIHVPAPAGLSVRKEPKYIVENIELLYGSAPYLVSLTANDAAIKAAIKGLTGTQTLPGVKHWWEPKAIVSR